jgi:hypothetical protein
MCITEDGASMGRTNIVLDDALVDTSAWVEYFAAGEGAAADRIAQELERGRDALAILPVIATELLQGFRSDRDFERALRVVRRLPCLAPGFATHVRAAALYRKLRARGVTVRSAVDCIIAATCLETGAALLTLDRDFGPIARHAGLRLA